MRDRPKLLVFLLLGLFLLCQRPVSATANQGEKVNFVEVQLRMNGKIYEGLQERIEFSVARVAEKILISQPVSLLVANKETVRAAILNVFSKVLVGFKLETVDLAFGENTKIILYLTPVPPLISNVQVNLEIQKINPELNSITKEVALRVEEELNQVFDGLPVASVSWSEGIFNLVVNYLLEKELPGFSNRFTLKAGTTTEINLTLIPQGPVVSEVTVDYTASNFPDLLIKARAKGYQEKFNLLKGIPVDFLIHYQPSLERCLTEKLNDFSELRNLGLSVKLGIKPGEKTKVKVAVDSRMIQLKFEGRYFVSEEENFSNFQTYLGYRNSDFELFTRYYWGNNPGGRFKVGYGVHPDRNFTIALEYGFDHAYKQVGFHYQFDRGDYLDLKLGVDNSPNEASIGIFLNKYTNLELVDYANNIGAQIMLHF